jgi:hypothetical protein
MRELGTFSLTKLFTSSCNFFSSSVKSKSNIISPSSIYVFVDLIMIDFLPKNHKESREFFLSVISHGCMATLEP